MIFHIIENLYRKCLLRATKNIINKNRKILNEINQNSFFILTNFFDQNEINILNEDFDKLFRSQKKKLYNYYIDKEESDERVFNFQDFTKNADIVLNNDLISNIYKGITGRISYQTTVMANKVEYKENNKGSGGGWHKDSPIRTQFKAFIYLNDVNANNGPLEIIKGSHSLSFSIKNSFPNLFDKKYRFSNEEIESNREFVQKKEMLCGKAGTLILANTKAIHRGKPILEGYRKALTVYFGDPDLKLTL